MKNAEILTEARERFRHCQNFESYARANWKNDFRFGHGDSTNMWMWSGDTIDSRNASGKPCFTVNRTRNYCLQIINDAKQNKAQVEVRAVGDGASFQAAQILEGIVRHIEYISNAEAAYEQAAYEQVFAGLGFWRVITDYAHTNSFDQEIFIRPLKALNVYLDPYIQQSDGSDARFGFIFTEMSKDQFQKDYPRYKDSMYVEPFGAETHDDLWVREERIRVCEYFRKIERKDTLHLMPTGDTMKESDMPDEQKDTLTQMSLNQRDIAVDEVEWYMIAGDNIVDHATFPSKYIPIVRCLGTEIVVDGQMDRFGHVRNLIDPQRSYNYYTSAGIEFVANQTKSPWMADIRSIEGVEEYWRDSNVKNYAVLPYKGVGDDGQPVEPPRRADPPVYAAAFLDGMKVSASEMEITSAQPPASMGDTSNERSGKAVLERQRAAANSTYHFVNNLSSAVRFTGKILIDMLPRIYDSQRTLKILAQDGKMLTIQINPNAPMAHVMAPPQDGDHFDQQTVSMILNPSIGEYDVVAEVGPQFSTRRAEFVSAMFDILAQNESLTPLVGDLVFRNLDFPGADEIADRMRRMVPPQALGNSNPQVTQMQQLLAQQHALLMQTQEDLRQAKQKGESIALQKDIDYYKAMTERTKVLGSLDPQAIRPMIREEISQLLGMPVNEVIAAHLHEDALMNAQAIHKTETQMTEEAQAQQQVPPQGPAQ